MNKLNNYPLVILLYCIMKYTNLNISDGSHLFKYIVEYESVGLSKLNDLHYYGDPIDEETSIKDDGVNVFFHDARLDNVISRKNYWVKVNTTLQQDDMPATYNEDVIRLYFPRFSVETYERKVLYVLTINTWINGKYVFLGSYLIDRRNVSAIESGPKKFLDDTYYEYVEIPIVNVNDLIYSDDWQDFRVNVCGEQRGESLEQLNNTGSNINVTLTAVKQTDDTYVKLEGYDSSQSTIGLIDKTDLSAHLDFVNANGEQKFVCKVKYNDVYSNLSDYLFETYFIDPSELKINFDLFIKTKTDAYKFVEHTFNTIIDNDTFQLNEFEFDKWKDYIQGMNANVVVVIERDNEDFLVFSSNEIPITQEIFAYIVKNNALKYVDLSTVNMTIQNLDVVNRIVNEIYTIDRKEDAKSNIINNVFVKVQPAGTITIHNGVNENIVLNLDAYKNKVDAFSLKIGSNVFYEVGRINAGIVFKIVGNKLEGVETVGQYYILSGEDLVTTGNYTMI